MITQNLTTLEIHKLSSEQFKREKENGSLKPGALYLTPDEEEYATIEQLNSKADKTITINGKALESNINLQVEDIPNAASIDDIKAAVAELVDSSPETLDTLNELAKALGEDPNFATTMANELSKKANKSDIQSYINEAILGGAW